MHSCTSNFKYYIHAGYRHNNNCVDVFEPCSGLIMYNYKSAKDIIHKNTHPILVCIYR